jgi:cytoskeletal protein CcmA (bactofilin family)
MNTKGITVLAVLAVLAMAFAALAVVTTVVDNDAEEAYEHDLKYLQSGQGLLDFTGKGKYDATDFSNEDLGNKIVVSYDAEAKKYTITGTLNQQKLDDASSAFVKMWPSNTEYKYGLVFQVDVPEGNHMYIGSKTYTAGADNSFEHLQYIKQTGSFIVIVETDDGKETYTVDYSGVTLADKHSDDAGFVGLIGENDYVSLNVDGAYLETTNQSIGNSVKITEVEKSSSDLYKEYTIDAKLVYVADLNAKGMDVPVGTEYKYALIWQVVGLESFDNYLGATLPFGMKWSASGKEWYGAQATEKTPLVTKYCDKETFAIYFKDVALTPSSSSALLYFGPVNMPSSSDVSAASKIKINFNVELLKGDNVKDVTTAAKAEEAAGQIKDAMGKSATSTKTIMVEISNAIGMTFAADTVIGDKETLIVATDGTGTISGDLKIGTGSDAKKVKLTGVMGTIEITKGSIKIFANPWSDGKITLYKGDVAKISGDVGEVEFDYGSTDGTATILVEEGTTLNIGTSLTILSSKISMEIDGEVTGLLTDILATTANTNVSINAGAEVSGIDIGANIKLTVYSGSDINAIHSIATIADVTGKDDNGGTWKIEDGKLLLNNYNGTYNLYPVQDVITSIDLTGNNTLTYNLETIPAYGAMLGKSTVYGSMDPEDDGFILQKITTDIGAGSLAIIVDISGVDKSELGHEFAIIAADASAGFVIDQAVVNIQITGYNSDWTEEDLAGMVVAGIALEPVDEGTMKMYNAALNIDVLSDYSLPGAEIYAIDGTDWGEDPELTSLEIASSIVSVKSASFAIGIEKLDLKGSIVKAKGIFGVSEEMAVTNETSLDVEGVLAAKNLTVKQESTITTDNAVFMSEGGANKAYNNATITVKEDLIIADDAIFTNNSVLNVGGSTIVLGNLVNANGTLNNTGTITVPAYIAQEGIVVLKNIAINVAEVTLATNAVMVKNIAFTTDLLHLNVDGTVDVAATVTFVKNGGATFDVFYPEGTLKAYNDGTGYVLALIGENDESTITVDFDNTKTDAKIGSKYSVSVSGTATEATIKYNIVPNTTGKVVTPDFELATVIQESGAQLTLTKGGLVSQGNVFTFVPVIIDEEMGYAGTLNAAANVTISGSVLGNITSTAGTVTMNKDSEMMGAIDAKGAVTINGKLLGNVTTDGDVTVGADGVVTSGNITSKAKVTVNGELYGDIEVSLTKGTENVVEVAGTVEGKLTYKSKYVKTNGDTTDTVGTAVIELDGKATYVINLKKGTDATTTTEGVPGYFSFGGNPAVADPTKATIEFTLTEGKFFVDSALIMPEGSSFIVEAGTTFEILKNYSFDVRNSALKISKDAIAHIDTGLDVPVYGKVLYIMAFETAEGYYIFSNAAYALSNCDEGSELVVGYTTTINTAVSIKAGVNIIIADDVTVTFGGNTVEMGEGAKITLSDKGVVIFNPTGDNKAGLPASKEYEYYTVSGTFVYGDNTLLIDEVRFSKDSTIYAIPETSTTVDMMGVDLIYNEGGVAVVQGTVKGSVELEHTHYYMTRADEAAKDYTLVAGVLGVEANGIFIADSLKDAGMVAEWSATSKTIVYTDRQTIVGFQGIIYLQNDTTINGTYVGDGSIILADGKKITLTQTTKTKSGTGAEDWEYLGAIFSGNICNGLIPTSSYEITALKAYNEGNVVFTSVAPTSTVPGYITIAGKAYFGIIEAMLDADLNGFYLMKDVSLTAPSVTVIDNSVADGIVKTVVLTVASGKALTYDTTYEDGEYTVYTAFKNIDLDEITDLTIADNKSLSDLGIDSKLDLSDKDFTLTVAEGKTLVIDKILIIGTPATDLGDYGSAMVGKFVITDKNYIVAYADVDLTDAEFKGRADTAVPAIAKEAVSSTLDIEDVPYAVIIAVEKDVANNTGIQLSVADKAIVPDITGYNFTKWNNYDDNNASYVGETNAYAGTKAMLVTVVAKYAPGVTYYMNGIQFDFVDMEKKVEYGSTFTAKITDSKYQGTPLVNGAHTYIVTDSVELQVTGVSPVPEPQPEPEPEPEVGGISLTDILLIVLVVLIAIMVVILILRLNRS